jgi:hypothetical protein
MSEEIINRVAASGLITLDPADWAPKRAIVGLDLSDGLYMAQILKEKEFRAWLEGLDHTAYEGKTLAVYCSADALIPNWAYMLVSVRFQEHAEAVLWGRPEEVYAHLFTQNCMDISLDEYKDARIVLKGCGEIEVPPAVYLGLAARLRPLVRTLMFGEPCSTVPVYKKKKADL